MLHNSNLSNGTMFALADSDGPPLDADYARTRARWEPVMEITQVKGASEVHPEQSTEDEFADFEIHMDLLIGGQAAMATAKGDYARYALLNGLSLEASLGSRTVRDILLRERAENGQDMLFHAWEMSASGIAAVWAEDNTRESIFAAVKRKETYGTSGTRLSLRVFAGFDLTTRDARGDLVAAGLLIQAMKDPLGANFDRVRVIKGWLDSGGEQHEKVFDVLWSDDRMPAAEGKLPAVGNTVDPATALYDNSIGASPLVGCWEDPGFDPTQRSFSYVRVLEMPTPRHSTYDTAALGVDIASTQQAATIQERAWSSPI